MSDQMIHAATVLLYSLSFFAVAAGVSMLVDAITTKGNEP